MSIGAEEQVGRRRELYDRDIFNTLITPDTFRLILTQESLLRIANETSKILHRKLTTGDVERITAYVARLRDSRFYRITYGQAIINIAREFVNRTITAQRNLSEDNDDYKISGVAEDTDVGTISDYNRKELAQLTPDENQFKFTAHAERRGNAVIDEERIAGRRSSPNNIKPDFPLTLEMLNAEIYRTSKLIGEFIAPESVEKMFTRVQTSTTNYDSINLPHQVVQFDSRNRLPVSAANNYKWNLHSAGRPGQLGDVRMLDTLQQLIQMKLSPFWAPVNSSTINPYATIRMLVLEYAAACILVTEFNDPTISIPTVEQYHFELEVKQIVGDRMFLVPRYEIFHFRKPIAKNIDTFTVTFFTPFQPEVFDADQGVFTITYGNPTLFTINSPTTFNLNTGDLIYIYNSHSGNTAIDNEINRTTGQIITKLSNTQFTIAVDSSTLAGSETGINVYFGSKRMFFQIEFTTLEQ